MDDEKSQGREAQGDQEGSAGERGSRIEPWTIVSVRSRVDSLTQNTLVDDVKRLRGEGRKRLVLDLRGNRFLSFQAIRFCVETAAQLSEQGGAFALLGCPEKAKRHFEIYGSLKNIRIFRSEREFKDQPSESQRGNPPSDISEASPF